MSIKVKGMIKGCEECFIAGDLILYSTAKQSISMEIEPNDEDDLGREAALLRALVLDEYGTPPAQQTSNSDSSVSDPRSSGDESDPLPQAPHTTDPLYDAHADSEDEAWVMENLISRPQRRSVQPDIPSPAPLSNDMSSQRSSRSGVNDTKFQLSCPSCFALLCLQCQPHEWYEGQFRAIFVKNCVTKIGETLRVRVSNGTRRDNGDVKDVYRPVACKCCGTEVAVRDADDVYHFCNVVY